MKDFSDKGEIYILKNPSMQNAYKIGLTRLCVQKRIKSLRSTSVPTDFQEIFSHSSEHLLQLEKHIHKCLKNYRIDKGREFFLFSSDSQAIKITSDSIDSFTPRKYTAKEEAKIKYQSTGVKPSQVAKASGLKLVEVSNLTGVSIQTLTNWYKNKPELFDVVLSGCITKRLNESLTQDK